MLAGSIGGRVSLNRSEQLVSVHDYLEGEKDSPIRHEYVDGYVYAMAGASDRHNRIALNIASRLNDRFVEGPCEVFMSDMKLRVSPNVYYYPDVVVSCDSPPQDAYSRGQPVLIIEVTSPPTLRIDHHEKLVACQHIPGLREFVLISQDLVRVEVHRQVSDEWRQEILSQAPGLLTLESISLSIKLAEVYRNVRFSD